MSDLTKCQKCGKMTNTYFPYCEHCSGSLETQKDASDADPKTIQEQGAAMFAKLEKYSKQTKKCPFCAEEILADAVKCRFCGEFVNKPAASGKKRNALPRAIGLVLVLALVYVGVAGLLKGGTGIKYDMGPSPELKKDAVKANYVKKYITLSSIGTLEESDQGGASTKYFTGTIDNFGDKLVIKLTLSVYYFDKKSRCIGEGIVAPILGTKAKPASIKPKGSSKFKVPLFNVSPDWSGKIKAKVSDIELLD